MTRASGLDVPIGRVGRTSGGRARWAALVWAAAMVAVVAPAIGQRLTQPPVEAAPRAAVAGPHADPGPIASAKPTWGLPTRASRPGERAPGERTTGEDGLMGSLVLDPQPQYPFVLWWPVGKLGWTTNPAQS